MEKQILSNFKELPKSKIGWWVLRCGVVFLISSIIALIFIYKVDYFTHTILLLRFGIIIIISTLALSSILFFLTPIIGIIAYKKGERSWVVLTGLSLIVLIGVIFLIFWF